jgi:hypothetical protein
LNNGIDPKHHDLVRTNRVVATLTPKRHAELPRYSLTLLNSPVMRIIVYGSESSGVCFYRFMTSSQTPRFVNPGHR